MSKRIYRQMLILSNMQTVDWFTHNARHCCVGNSGKKMRKWNKNTFNRVTFLCRFLCSIFVYIGRQPENIAFSQKFALNLSINAKQKKNTPAKAPSCRRKAESNEIDTSSHKSLRQVTFEWTKPMQKGIHFARTHFCNCFNRSYALT